MLKTTFLLCSFFLCYISVTANTWAGPDSNSVLIKKSACTAIVSSSGKDVSCFGYSDGKAWVTPVVTSPQPSYTWSGSANTNDTLINLTAGTYTVTVTDNTTCSETAVITINQPTALTGTTSSTNSTCNAANDGTATIIPAGGTPPYAYSWNSSPSQSTATATNLSPGTYTIKLSDSKGCEFYANVSITEPSPLFINTPVITKETCLLGNGRIVITHVGGTPTYTYAWSPPANLQTTSTVTNLSAGTYTVTVTDSKGCSATKTAVVTNQNTPPTATMTSVNNVTCNGSANGSAFVLASSGTGPYGYVWSPSGGAAATATGLAPNTYTVTVTDANGCKATSTATITEPSAMSLNPSSANVTCGLGDGFASVSPSGGTFPYKTTWSNAVSGNTNSNLASGTYVVTVTDGNSCSQTTSFTLVVTNPLNVSASGTNVTCNGLSNGTATVTSTTGGSGSFNYSWSPGGSTLVSVSGLGVATYVVTVSDAINPGCTATATVNLTQPAVLNANISGTNVTCNGLNNGQASSSPTGGTTGYNYSWNTTSTSSSITGLSPATYTVTVTDVNSCTATSTVTITQSSAVTASLNAKTDVLCFGASTGSASINSGGGTGALTYTWNPSGGSSSSASGLAAGAYTVVVNDANSCSATVAITITQPTGMSVTPSTTNTSCGLTGGIASVAVTGGSGAYTYVWSGAVAGNTSTASNLNTGSYVVTITDANGCSQTQSFTINVANPLTITTGRTNIVCNGQNNGTAGVTVTGGTGSYNFSWNPGGSTAQTITGLTTGTYVVTVTDAVNSACTATASLTITQPTTVVVSITVVNITCFGQTNGELHAVGGGGTPPGAYAWSAPIVGTWYNQFGLGAGTYTVTFTDANGCSATSSATITAPPALNISLTKTNLSCYGACDGTISTTVSGGTPNYTYSWSPAGGPTGNITALCAATYTLTVTDAIGCSSVTTTTITEPPAIALTTGGTNPSCYINDGTAYVSASGGSGSFGYLWNPTGGTGTTITGLGAGTYVVTVTDLVSNCVAISLATITYPVVGVVLIPTNVTCNGLNNGSAYVIPSGTAPPFTYLWTGGFTSATISGLSPGTYNITVTGSSNCVGTGAVTITQPAVLSMTKSFTNVSCFGMSNGTASVAPVGGTAGYNYTWSSGQITSAISGLSTGTYVATITDANNCTTRDSVTISQSSSLSVVTDSTNVTCSGLFNGQVRAAASGGTGPYNYTWNPGAVLNDTLYNVGIGVYTVTVSDVNGCTVTDDVSVIQPGGLVLGMGVTNTDCGLSTGSATVTVSGGSLPYIFLWNQGSTGATISSLAKGTYTVTVTDNNGCFVTSTVSITEPAAISISFAPTNISCNGAADGSITASASGGSSGFIYSWIPGGTSTATISGLAPGTYAVKVSDSSSPVCFTIDSVTITQPALLSSSISKTDMLCFGINNGTATAAVTGGSGLYTYSWSNAVTGITSNPISQISNLTSQIYSVTITDSKGCVTSTYIAITQPTTLATTTASQQNTCGNADGKVWVTPTGGTGAYTYLWSPIFSATDTLKNISSGKYYVVVTDVNGCTKKDSATIILSTVISTTLTTVPSTCYGRNDAQINTAVAGGSGTYIYKWSPGGSTNQNLINLTPGTYFVTVSDAFVNTCFKTDSVIVTEPVVLTVNPAITKATCVGSNNYIATANAAGGNPGYFYTWSFGGSGLPVESNLSPGTFALEVMDSKGCDTSVIFDITGSSTPFILPPKVYNPNCNSATGAIKISVFGGASPLAYAWSPSVSVTDTAANIASGTYSITVTDAYNCANTRSVTVNAATLPPNITSTSSTPAPCYGASTGYASVTAQAGTPAYTYSWSPSGGTGSTTTGVPAGTYTVTVTDSKLCTATSTVTVGQSSALDLSATATDATCSLSNGSASASAVGGTPGYTYAWSNGTTAQTMSGVLANTYTVTITDGAGCVGDTVLTINTTINFLSNITSTNILCYNTPTGNAVVTPAGGSPNYTYSWSNSVTGATITNVIAGGYTVTIVDQNGCTSITSATITQPVDSVSITVAATTSLCSTATGTADVSAIGGSPGYLYSWSNNSTGTSISGLDAGIYNVTVTDNNGCTVSSSALVNNTSGPTANITVINDVLCLGTATGNAVVNATGGTPGYTYNWSNSVTGATINNLIAGSYAVTVTDQNGCIAVSNTTITEPIDSVSITTATTTSMCSTSTGAASVMAVGGTPGYVYSWDNGPTSASNNGLAAGIYSVTVTDNNGCTITSSALINNANGPTPTVTITNNVLCFGTATGNAVASAAGGTPGYSYSWSNTIIGATINNLIAGVYAVTVTDQNGCIGVSNTTITEPIDSVSITISTTPSICSSGSGSAAVTAIGGTPGYVYSWDNGPTSASNNGLAAGIYSVTVTDNNGCTITSSALINNTTSPTATIAVSNILCFNTASGSAVVTAAGGVPGYLYNWSNSITGATINNLVAGVYDVTVSDQNGCTSTSSATITQPIDSVSISIATTSSMCTSFTGTATVSAIGGTPGYTYSWNTGSTGTSIGGLAASIYNVTVTDNNGCTISTSAVINNSNGPSVTIVPSNVLCFGTATGSAVANVTGGTPGYTYSWSSSSTAATANNLVAGFYTVTVVDQNGCAAFQTTTLTEPFSIVSGIIITTQSNCTSGTGSAVVSAAGGTPGYFYSWNDGQSAMTAVGLSAGNYTVTVTDNNGCSISITTAVTNSNAPTVNIAVGNNALCFGTSTGVAIASATGGAPAYTYGWSNTVNGATSTNLIAGTYTVTVADQNGCTSTQTILITQPANAVSAIISATNPNCGTSNGVVSIAASGGTAGYSYSWNTNSTGKTINGLGAGTFSVTVTDANGCTLIADTFLVDVPGVAINVNVTNAVCAANADGNIKIVPISGTPAYTYLWNTGATTDSISKLVSGTYSLTITDAIGCQTQTTVNIGPANPTPVADFIFIPTSNIGPDTIIYFTDLSTPGSTLRWTFGEYDPSIDTSTASNPTKSYFDNGTYCVNLTATNSSGCSSSIEKCLLVFSDSLFIPNVFTPNGDGVNDLFIVFANGMKHFTFEIYDRWGLRMFDGGTTRKIMWDGKTVAGLECPSGTYYYMYNGETIKGRIYKGSGFLTLIRGPK